MIDCNDEIVMSEFYSPPWMFFYMSSDYVNNPYGPFYAPLAPGAVNTWIHMKYKGFYLRQFLPGTYELRDVYNDPDPGPPTYVESSSYVVPQEFSHQDGWNYGNGPYFHFKAETGMKAWVNNYYSNRLSYTGINYIAQAYPCPIILGNNPKYYIDDRPGLSNIVFTKQNLTTPLPKPCTLDTTQYTKKVTVTEQSWITEPFLTQCNIPFPVPVQLGGDTTTLGTNIQIPANYTMLFCNDPAVLEANTSEKKLIRYVLAGFDLRRNSKSLTVYSPFNWKVGDVGYIQGSSSITYYQCHTEYTGYFQSNKWTDVSGTITQILDAAPGIFGFDYVDKSGSNGTIYAIFCKMTAIDPSSLTTFTCTWDESQGTQAGYSGMMTGKASRRSIYWFNQDTSNLYT